MSAPRRAATGDDFGTLRRDRPKSLFVRISLALFATFTVAAWFLGDIEWSGLFAPKRARNFERFLGEIRPYPLHGRDWDWTVAWSWARDIVADRGAEAMLATLAISVAAIALAAVLGLPLTLGAARNVATAEPFLPGGRRPRAALRFFWRAVVGGTRLLLIILRSIPEYLWAFLLVAVFGPSAWPAVLALALHNAGILGRLGAETIENVEAQGLTALRAAGATRPQIALFGILPTVLPRLLLYFFYRWETCVREATVLGLLGIASLGFWIEDARVRLQYDDFMLFVLLGALIVMAGDVVSAVLRGVVRRAS